MRKREGYSPITLRKLPSGKRAWYADYYDELGNRQVFSLKLPESVPFAAAMERFLQLKEIKKRERLNIRIEDAFERFIKFKEHTRDKIQTVREYRRVLGHFLDYVRPRRIVFLSDIKPEHIAGYASWQQLEGRGGRGRTNSGINSDLRQLKAVLNWLDRQGEMPTNYNSRGWFDDAMLRKPDKRWRIVNDLELPFLLSDEMYGDIYHWLYLTGARVGVVLQLHNSHVNLKDRIITYPPGKHGRIHRQVITEQMLEFLETHKPSSTDGFLFWRDRFGNPFVLHDLNNARTSINKRMQRVLKKHGFQDLPHTHDLRATCATALLRAGVDPYTIVKFIDWKEIRTFLEHYDRLRPEEILIPRISGAEGIAKTN